MVGQWIWCLGVKCHNGGGGSGDRDPGTGTWWFGVWWSGVCDSYEWVVWWLVDLVVSGSSESVDLAPVGWWLRHH